MTNRRPLQFSLLAIFIALTAICIMLAGAVVFLAVCAILFGLGCGYLALRDRDADWPFGIVLAFCFVVCGLAALWADYLADVRVRERQPSPQSPPSMPERLRE
jgi:hypothetical protein